MKQHLVIAVVLLASGCTTSYTDPNLPANHPASAAAMEAPSIERSHTLDLAVSEPTPASRTGEPMGHSGHEMGAASRMDAGPAPVADAKVGYACPMHPEVTSDKPDQRCPKCNMKLKPVSAAPASKPGGAR